VYSATNQNLSDAIIQDQIDVLNQAFRGQLSPGPNGAPVPSPFAPLVGDARVQFCLATRDPSGSPTTGITRRNNTSTQYAGTLNFNTVRFTLTGGTDAWNTTQYLNIWCGDLPSFTGQATFPGEVTPSSGLDGVVISYTAFGRGHTALDVHRTLGRTAVHEVGHWLDLKHIYGGGTSGCTGSDLVNDTPVQAGSNSGNPTFPIVSCSVSSPNGDMFMNHMDQVDDDSKLLFTAGQAARMQAVFATGGWRESLKSSPGLRPNLIITSTGTIPTAVNCGDQTSFRLRAGSGSVGCGGGTLQYQWAATNGWTVDNPAAYAPLITPNGTSSSTITLTGTYTNIHGVSFALNTASIFVSYNAAAGTPTSLGCFSSICTNGSASYIISVAPVAGATGYRWTVPVGIAPTGQTNTTTPSLTITPSAAGAAYTISCQALSGSCSPSAATSCTFIVNGGPRLKIVDSPLNQNPSQNNNGIVCARNYIRLQLVPVTPWPGFSSSLYNNIQWSVMSTGPSAGTITPTFGFPMEATYATDPAGNISFTVSAAYTDQCNSPQNALTYAARTDPAAGNSLSNGYNCIPNRWRPAPQPPYPNPATSHLQLPGYQGAVVVYNQQGKPVHRLLAPGTEYGTAVDTSTWPDGLYVVTGRNLLGEFQRHNVQVQH
jgi:hypothetical protein